MTQYKSHLLTGLFLMIVSLLLKAISAYVIFAPHATNVF